MSIAIIGAGAAGTMAAIFAARSGVRTLVLERTREGCKKILISGGGRCNVLPSRLDESRFVTDSSPNTLKRIVRSWPLREQIAFFEHELHLPLVEEPESAKLFPASQRARDVRDALLNTARDAGAELLTDTLVTGLAPTARGWRIELNDAPPLDVDAVIVATGGLSVPNTGSDGMGLRMLNMLGHTMRPTYAALTPVLASGSPFSTLAGVSFPITLQAKAPRREARATGGFLFTHHGYSGPAALDVSHVVVRARAEGPTEARLHACWTTLNESDWTARLSPQGQGTRPVLAVLRVELPERLALVLLDLARVDASRTLAELRRDERLRLIDVLVRCPLPWTSDEGYKKAEVTGGGVDLSEIDPRTMESRRHPRLFLCGEVLDAFGPIGGYNFLWAWATGRAAGLGAAASCAAMHSTSAHS
ncbi:MAG TPA: aminoacetone oxidase family FAD-binding enzyme [Burkholderiaceae bacterium]|nr:aminoacetone oxidase family FAD-binding enzyme [Burkholderiaceae bacterium]